MKASVILTEAEILKFAEGRLATQYVCAAHDIQWRQAHSAILLPIRAAYRGGQAVGGWLQSLGRGILMRDHAVLRHIHDTGFEPALVDPETGDLVTESALKTGSKVRVVIKKAVRCGPIDTVPLVTVDDFGVHILGSDACDMAMDAAQKLATRYDVLMVKCVLKLPREEQKAARKAIRAASRNYFSRELALMKEARKEAKASKAARKAAETAGETEGPIVDIGGEASPVM